MPGQVDYVTAKLILFSVKTFRLWSADAVFFHLNLKAVRSSRISSRPRTTSILVIAAFWAKLFLTAVMIAKHLEQEKVYFWPCLWETTSPLFPGWKFLVYSLTELTKWVAVFLLRLSWWHMSHDPLLTRRMYVQFEVPCKFSFEFSESSVEHCRQYCRRRQRVEGLRLKSTPPYSFSVHSTSTSILPKHTIQYTHKVLELASAQLVVMMSHAMHITAVVAHAQPELANVDKTEHNYAE